MQITAVDGAVHNFNPTKINYIADKRANDQEARFYLHGLRQGVVAVSGDPATFVASLPNPGRFAYLTMAHGNRSVWVRGPNVATVHSLSDAVKTHHAGANAAVGFGADAKQILVTEDVDAAAAAIVAAGGTI